MIDPHPGEGTMPRPAPPASPRRRGRRPLWLPIVAACALAVATPGLLLAARGWAEGSRAPDVSGIADYCSLSPTGTYLAIRDVDSHWHFLDTATHREVLHLATTREAGGYWGNDREFVVMWFQGWYFLADPAQAAVRWLPDLPEAERAALEARQPAYPLSVYSDPLTNGPWPSPDGRWAMTREGIRDGAGRVVNPVPVRRSGLPRGGFLALCEHGWRADSAGVYYLSGTQEYLPHWYGPVRLLRAPGQPAPSIARQQLTAIPLPTPRTPSRDPTPTPTRPARVPTTPVPRP